MKFFKTIRFDGSDENVYLKAAEPDEWTVSGCFEFAAIEQENLTGKLKQAFRNGMMGLQSYGRTTFVVVADMKDDEYEHAVQLLVDYFMTEFGAPSREEAEAAVAPKIALSITISTTPAHTTATALAPTI